MLPTPASLASFWTSPVGSQLISAVLGEFWATPNRPFAATDESVDSFLSRRFGPEIARVFASAMIHGIYAADSRKLSVRAAFPSLWEAETRGNGSVVWGFMKSPSPAQELKYEISPELKKIMENTSVYSFKDGISTLTNALAAELKQDKNVDLRVGDAVVSLELDESFAVSFKVSNPFVMFNGN
jgi:oxygen-dependent protoporphyrinogen oxidase